MKDKLGLKRGTVIIINHQQGWAQAFKLEKKFLQRLLGDAVLDIQHIGSTAVPGLAAKPIIDMLMGVESLMDASDFRSSLEKAGYEYRENGSNDKKMLFVKGPEELRTHYLHITKLGSSVWQNDLAFRDFLRSHPEIAAEYENVKIELASKYADNRKEYTAGKGSFIESILRLAGLHRKNINAS